MFDQPAIQSASVADDGESIALMEPILLAQASPHRGLEAVLFRGELPRGDVPAILNASERQARRVTAALVDRGALISANHRAPLRLAFPATLAPDWLPGLLPDRGS